MLYLKKNIDLTRIYANIHIVTSQEYKKLKLPDNPGVYFFMKGKVILYIGKATSLRSRVQSYFSTDLINMRGMFLVDMVTHADNIKWQETDSVLEALILEADLIKTHQPKYNTKEKDGKSFLCVVVTAESMPQVLMVRKKDIDTKNKTAKVSRAKKTVQYTDMYGPFTNGSQLKEAMKIVRRIFPYRDDASSKRDNYEFYKQLGLTPPITTPSQATPLLHKEGISSSPPFRGGVPAGGGGDYKKTITNLKLFFQGKKKKIITNLKKEMLAYAKVKEFEKANDIKKRIFALTHINDIALIKNDMVSNLPEKHSSPRPLAGFLRPARLSAKIFGPESDQAKFSVAVSARNIFPSDKPIRIEAYDIAHLSGKDMVGVMVVVTVSAQGYDVSKDEYRKFNIKTVQGANDPAALAEILTRRLEHVYPNAKGGRATWELPNIIVVDGNEVQKNTAEKILKEKGYNIPVVALVKDDKHKARGLIGPKGIVTAHKQAILLANSEAHRFAIAYHKLKRGKSFLK